MLRILIADDHAIVRQGLIQILKEEFPMAIIEDAEDTITLIQKAIASDWDIIISDLAMPGGGGLHALEKIKLHHPEIPFLIISTHPEEQYGTRVINAGADAFLNKQKVSRDLAPLVLQLVEADKNPYNPIL